LRLGEDESVPRLISLKRWLVMLNEVQTLLYQRHAAGACAERR
jgi:hypothetical protein